MTCWSSCLFGIFIVKQHLEFSLIFFGTAKQDFVIKTRKSFNFLPLIDSSVITGLSFLFQSISEIGSSKTANSLSFFYLNCILQYFYKYHLEYSVKTSKSFKCFKTVFLIC